MTLRALVEDGLAPAAAMAWGDSTSDQSESTVASDTPFDVASLTKVMVTTAVTAALVREGTIELDDLVGRFVPESSVAGATVADLLAHRSGLSAYWHPPADLSPEEVRDTVLVMTPEAAPGVQTTYSCLGFVTLQLFLERATGETLDGLYERLVRVPLGLSARFGPVDGAMPTSDEQPGIVHDPLARALGGVSGNAGLFGTLSDVVRFARAVVLEEPPVADLLAWGHEVSPYQGRGYGWQVFDQDVFGHTGFTGCRLWISPADRRWAVLLTNRVAAERDPEEFRAAAEVLRNLALCRTSP